MEHFFGLDLQDGSLSIGLFLLLVSLVGGFWLYNIPELPGDCRTIFQALQMVALLTAVIIIFGSLRLKKTAIDIARWLLALFILLDLGGIVFAVYIIIIYVNKDEVLHEGQFIPWVVSRFFCLCFNIYFIFVLNGFYRLLAEDESQESETSVRAENTSSHDTNYTY